MSARLLDGVAVANQIRAEVAPAVAAFTARAGRPPGLGIVLVGDDPASEIYVRNKLKSAGDAGLRADLERLPATMGAGAEHRVFDVIRPDKDVDGFHPINVGHLVQNRATLAACTPSGVIELLERSHVPIAGARAVVIGRSDIVGKPMALLLLHRHATVTICHSRTPDLPGVCATADILIAAIGRAGFVTADFVKPGATVIDVGTTRVEDPEVVNRLLPASSKRREAFARRGAL